MPYLDLASDAHCEMATRGRKGEGSHFAAEGEVVEDDAAGNVGQDCAAILVDGEKKVSAGVECEANNVLAMGKGKRVRL